MHIEIEDHQDNTYGLDLGDATVSIQGLTPDAIATGVRAILTEHPYILAELAGVEESQLPNTEEEARTLPPLFVAGQALEKLQEITKRQGWSESYFVEQLLRNFFELPADYDSIDLQLIKVGVPLE